MKTEKLMDMVFNEDYRAACNQIREIRRNLGMSQADFADFIGLPVHIIFNWESGTYCPSVYTAWLIRQLVELKCEKVHS